MTIKHLVISGGGQSGLQILGILQELHQNNVWKLSDIESIYATSAGTMLSVLLMLGFEWETIYDYIVLRPWQEAFPIKPLQIFNIITKKGLFDSSFFDIFYEPFFNAKDISLKITMKEFFEFTKIDCHFYAIDINTFEVTDFSHYTHPDLPIIQAVHMSSTIPLLFIPYSIENKCFIDGGILINYPLQECMKKVQVVEEILGIKKIDDALYPSLIHDESNFLDYISCFIHNIMKNIKTPYVVPNNFIPNEIIFYGRGVSFQIMKEMLYSSTIRKDWIDGGYVIAKEWLLKRKEIIQEPSV